MAERRARGATTEVEVDATPGAASSPAGHDQQPTAGTTAPGRVTLVGWLESVTIQPAGARPFYEAVLDDEKRGRVHLIWHGQRHVPGVDAGVTLRVEGTLSQQERRPVIFDPHYEILHNGGEG